MSFFRNKRNVWIYAVLIGLLFISHFSFHDYPSVNRINIESEEYIDNSQSVVPMAVERTKKGHFVIAGYAKETKEAWALKADKKGREIWRHSSFLHKENKETFRQGPKYSSIALMADESVFLCGTSGSPVKGVVQGILTHLDEDGKQITSLPLVPRSVSDRSINRISGCVPYQDGLLLIGSSYDFSASAGKTGSVPQNIGKFWVSFWDKEGGSLRWEMLIPMWEKAGDQHISWRINNKNDIYIAGARNGIGTEVLRINVQGQVIAKKRISDAFIIVQSENQIDELRLASNKTQPLTLVSFDKELQEKSRVSKNYPKGTVTVAYQLNDGGFILPGAKNKDHISVARVLKLDKDNWSFDELVLDKNGGSYNVDASTLNKETNRLVCVKRKIPPYRNTDPVDLRSKNRKVAINYIDVN